MSESKAARAVKKMFGALGAPPKPEAAGDTLSLPAGQAAREKSDRTEQLNLRVPLSLKRRVRLLAARDNISLSEVVIRAIDLYEERHGRAPDL